MKNFIKEYVFQIAVLVVLIVGVVAIVSSIQKPDADQNTNTQTNQESFAGSSDVNKTPRIHQTGITTGTSTICAQLNSDGRDRIITKVSTFNADWTNTDSQGTGNTYTLGVATSSSPSATSTLWRPYVNNSTWASSTPGAGYSSSSPAIQASGAATLNIWPTGSYLLYRLFDGVNGQGATSSPSMTGYCATEYLLDM